MTFAFIIRTVSPSARLTPSHSVCRILYAPSVTINRPSPKPKATESQPLPRCPDCDIKVKGFTRSRFCARVHISSQPNPFSAFSAAPVHIPVGHRATAACSRLSVSLLSRETPKSFATFCSGVPGENVGESK